MTPTNTTAKNADAAKDGGASLAALTEAVAGFEASQSEALAAITRQAQAVGEELALLSQRPTHEELAGVQSTLEKVRADHSQEVGELKATIADRDVELEDLRRARATDAATIASLQDRFRSFEAAAQSIMAGLAGDSFTPPPVAVKEAAATPAPEAAAEPAPEPVHVESKAEAAAPTVSDDPFGLDTPAAAPAPEEAAPVAVVIPDLDEGDPFDANPARAALLAQAVGTDDPFDLPEAPSQEEPPAPKEAPAGQKAGAIVDDPFAFMDLDTPAAPAVQEAPKVVPVYI
ncbi:hypothetical protein [Pseudarthrobacter sp. BIM B-2242]|uniref:hypothetical protein n=1 Tax=Pseudarthrobacter sp. BIM B-2242 TaxID=2772401 RepID=UPI00168AA066|nr:hypothetical protein [Pseudarthrobacter sp. BIM B-2242]QOD05732.1 hypothetical protein IDT60_22080 [Pseudarthrobacter sp. BIM B-2242]